MTTLTAITAIGATIGAVGAVTHNKTLSLIGAGLGIVGAVGTLAFGSGALGSVGDLFGSSSMSAADTASLATGADASLSEALSSVPGASLTSADVNAGIINATGAVDTAAMSAAPSLSAAQGNAAAIESAGQGGAGGALAQSLSPSVTDPAAAAASASAGGVPGAAPDITGAAAGAGPGGASIFSTPGVFDPTNVSAAGGFHVPGGLMNWAKDNQLLAFGAMQAGGSFLSGLTNPLSPAQIDALSSQSEVNRATAALLQRQAANQGGAIPTAVPTVTGRAEMPGTGGLINSRPVNAPLITGAPNSGLLGATA